MRSTAAMDQAGVSPPLPLGFAHAAIPLIGGVLGLAFCAGHRVTAAQPGGDPARARQTVVPTLPEKA